MNKQNAEKLCFLAFGLASICVAAMAVSCIVEDVKKAKAAKGVFEAISNAASIPAIVNKLSLSKRMGLAWKCVRGRLPEMGGDT